MNTFWKYWGKENDCYRISISTTISGREGRSAVVLVPTKPPLTLRVHQQKRVHHVSEITWILRPTAWVFLPCSYLLTKPTQGLTGKSISCCSPGEQEGPYPIVNPLCSPAPQAHPWLHFFLSTDPHLDTVQDGNSLGFLEFITTLIHSKHTGKHETIERAFQLSPWICHQMWNIIGKLSRGEIYIFQAGKICKTTLHHL